MSKLPELQHTPIESIPSTVNFLRTTFNTQKTRNVEFRLKQLRKLYWGYARLSNPPIPLIVADALLPLQIEG